MGVRRFGLLVSLVGLAAGCRQAPRDHLSQAGVLVSFEASPDIFPPYWLAPPINARCEPLDTRERARVHAVILCASEKYPVELLRRNLRAVYLLGSFRSFGLVYGATNSNSALFITS